MERPRLRFACLVLALAMMGTAGAQTPENPDDHIAIENAASLTPAEAQEIYQQVADQMAIGYAASKEPTAMRYRDWRSFNSTPYVSKTHGNRFVNNYANDIAENYGRLEPGEKLPAGSIVVKDSLTVTEERNVFPGALFAMEKLPAGQSPTTGDWRFLMVMPDGSVFGDSQADSAENVQFCSECHARVAGNDYLYDVPKAARLVSE